MAKCRYCWAETQMYDNGVPICLKCFEEIETQRKKREQKNNKTQISEFTGGDDLAIATSGAYNRGDHVVDPHTRTAPRGVLSVTVTGPDLATADAYATAAFAMGELGPHWTATLRGYEALTILANGTVQSTAGFPRL